MVDGAPPPTNSPLSWLADVILVAMEAVVLVIVCVSPWLFGAAEIQHRHWLFIALAILLGLWGLRMIVRWTVVWSTCPAVLCLVAVFLLGVFQLTPLPMGVLAAIAPAQMQIFGSLLPTDREVFLDGTQESPLVRPPEAVITETLTGRIETSVASTISFYPQATRTWLVNLLAVFLLFVVVRMELASPSSLYRLSVVTLANGAAMSLFGLVQFFSTFEEGLIYWTFQSNGLVFGPFINRNHFAFYINICVGLVVALLLAHVGRTKHELTSSRFALLLDPMVLWCCSGLAMMLSGVAFCQSRGGLLAVLGATAVCFLLAKWHQRSGGWKLGALGLSVAIALSLLVWFGLDPVVSRVSTIWTGEAFAEAATTKGGRVFLLFQSWPVLSQFPLLGTGFGTFEFVEPLWFHTPANVGTIYEHAHNDYLEDLVEGGLARFGFRLVMICFVYRYANRALQCTDPQRQAFALGLVFSFTTIVIHSFFEFGLHIPAIAALAAVVTAYLCKFGDCASEAEFKERPSEKFAGLLPVAGAAMTVVMGWFLFTEGARDANAETLRNAALARHGLALNGTASHETEIPFLKLALRLKPQDAELEMMLAEAHFGASVEQEHGSATTLGASSSPPTQSIDAGLRRMLRARDLCPILPTPHMRLAANIERFANADSRAVYMRRAQFLAPTDPHLWYFCGLHELEDGHVEAAYESWKHSLALSPLRLDDIMRRVSVLLQSDEIIHLLPDNANTIMQAADHLFPGLGASSLRKPFLTRALSLLENSADDLSDTQLHTKAKLYADLGQTDAAIKAFNTAIAHQPSEINWRYELAKLLYDQDQLVAARREVRMILNQKPRHARALQLSEELRRREAESTPRDEMRE